MILTHFGCNAAKPILTHTQQKRRKKNSFCLWNNDVGVPFGSSIYGWDSRNGFTSCENITDYVLNRTDDRYRLKCLTENIYICNIDSIRKSSTMNIDRNHARNTHTHTHTALIISFGCCSIIGIRLRFVIEHLVLYLFCVPATALARASFSFRLFISTHASHILQTELIFLCSKVPRKKDVNRMLEPGAGVSNVGFVIDKNELNLLNLRLN